MSRPDVSLMDCHGALSHLSYAIKATLPCVADVTIGWRNGIYLYAEIEVLHKYRQQVCDILNHGILMGDYDYRFKGMSYATTFDDSTDPSDWIVVTAYPDMCHDMDRYRKAA